jgi:hypothetical protein
MLSTVLPSGKELSVVALANFLEYFSCQALVCVAAVGLFSTASYSRLLGWKDPDGAAPRLEWYKEEP